MVEVKLTRNQRLILMLCLLGGVLLAVLGARYFIRPEPAARTFGVPDRPLGHELYYIIGLRNIWLGLLAIAFATLREWRALALWFTLGAVVCFADASIGIHVDRPLGADHVSRRVRLCLHWTCVGGLAMGREK